MPGSADIAAVYVYVCILCACVFCLRVCLLARVFVVLVCLFVCDCVCMAGFCSICLLVVGCVFDSSMVRVCFVCSLVFVCLFPEEVVNPEFYRSQVQVGAIQRTRRWACSHANKRHVTPR